jgi:hypothetical protein
MWQAGTKARVSVVSLCVATREAGPLPASQTRPPSPGLRREREILAAVPPPGAEIQEAPLPRTGEGLGRGSRLHIVERTVAAPERRLVARAGLHLVGAKVRHPFRWGVNAPHGERSILLLARARMIASASVHPAPAANNSIAPLRTFGSVALSEREKNIHQSTMPIAGANEPVIASVV